MTTPVQRIIDAFAEIHSALGEIAMGDFNRGDFKGAAMASQADRAVKAAHERVLRLYAKWKERNPDDPTRRGGR